MLSQRTAKYKSASTLGCSRRFSLAACLLLSSPARTAALQQDFCTNEATRIVINAAAGSLDATMSICKNFNLLRLVFPPSLSTCDISNSTVTFTGGIDGTFTITSETTDGRLVAVFKRSGGSLAPNHTAGDAATTVEFTLHNLKNISAPVPYNYRDNFTDFTYTISRQCTAPPLTGPCLPPAPIAPCPKLNDTTIKEAKTSWFANETASALKYCHIKDWDVSEVTTMKRLFERKKNFNGDVSSWDVSKVTDMNQMFYQAKVFNKDLSSWDVSKVTDMNQMFQQAFVFNGDLSSWNVSKVTNMRQMFFQAAAFNGSDLSSWDVSKVTDMHFMFMNAATFNGDVSSWDVSKVTNMGAMFAQAFVFNKDLSSWDVSKVTNMGQMFNNAKAFNGNLSPWDTSKVTVMGNMFSDAAAFNGNLSSWNVSKVPADSSGKVMNRGGFDSSSGFKGTPPSFST